MFNVGHTRWENKRKMSCIRFPLVQLILVQVATNVSFSCNYSTKKLLLATAVMMQI